MPKQRDRNRRRATLALAALVASAACSSGLNQATVEVEPVETSATTTTEATTITTTTGTTIRVSEQTEAEAKVAQVVEDFWTVPTDTSKDMFGLEYSSGTLKARLEGVIQDLNDNGQVLFNDKRDPHGVITVEVDVERGRAELKACQSTYAMILSAETGEEIFGSDPNFLATTTYYLEETDDGWKIYEFIGTAESDAPELCEIAESTPDETSAGSSSGTMTTASTIASTTTLSEQAQAEADVAQLVTDFWLTEVDTTTGKLGLEFMTGLIATRTQAWAGELADSGEGLRDLEGQKRVEITSVDIDLQAGAGEVHACMGSGSEVINLDTLEQIDIGSDSEFLSTSRLLVLKTPEGWKISEIYPSVLTGTAELCEIGD